MQIGIIAFFFDHFLPFSVGLFQLKYGERWTLSYELGKVSMNKRGNELAAEIKRSSLQKNSEVEVNSENVDPDE